MFSDRFGGRYLFPNEYVLVEVKLNLLIGDVDAELLERVLLEVLKTEDVQDADVEALVILPGGERMKRDENALISRAERFPASCTKVLTVTSFCFHSSQTHHAPNLTPGGCQAAAVRLYG